MKTKEKPRKRKYFWLLGYLIIAGIGFAPILGIVFAALTSAALGCTLNINHPNDCLIWEVNIGPFLHSLTKVGELAMICVPLAAILFIIWTVTFRVLKRK